MAAHQEGALDVDKQVRYCTDQVSQALNELRQSDGSYDYSMEPRNILQEDQQRGWNCRKASPQEWCSGFWPGILWMEYGITGNDSLRQHAEGYTEALSMLTTVPSGMRNEVRSPVTCRKRPLDVSGKW